MKEDAHYLPQVYMRRFRELGDSAGKNLSAYSLSRRRWDRKATKQICYFPNFYDHSDPTLDKSVKDLLWSVENSWNDVVTSISTPTIGGWKRALPDLLTFLAVQGVRNQEFRFANLKMSDGASSLERLADPRPQDRALEEMLAALPNVKAWLDRLDWCLRWTVPTDPFITCDECVFLEGSAPTRGAALFHPGTLVFFPVSSEYLLIGATSKLDVDAAPFSSSDMLRFRTLVFKTARDVVISPFELSLPSA